MYQSSCKSSENATNLEFKFYLMRIRICSIKTFVEKGFQNGQGTEHHSPSLWKLTLLMMKKGIQTDKTASNFLFLNFISAMIWWNFKRISLQINEDCLIISAKCGKLLLHICQTNLISLDMIFWMSLLEPMLTKMQPTSYNLVWATISICWRPISKSIKLSDLLIKRL